MAFSREKFVSKYFFVQKICFEVWTPSSAKEMHRPAGAHTMTRSPLNFLAKLAFGACAGPRIPLHNGETGACRVAGPKLPLHDGKTGALAREPDARGPACPGLDHRQITP
jgi:hypothetical protein